MQKSKRNKTITLNQDEIKYFYEYLIKDVKENIEISNIVNKIILGNMFDAYKYLPQSFVDLLILDPPYNLNKDFGEVSFKRMSDDKYSDYFEDIIIKLKHTLKPIATNIN